MAKFDGILLVSDWDGTICYKGLINPKNIDKIKYFQENGGLFTICTGRYPEHFKNNGYLDLIMPNTYILCLNGAIIQDIKNDEVLYMGFMGDRALDAFDKVIENNMNFKALMYYEVGRGEARFFSKEEYLRTREELSPYKTHKLVIMTENEEDAIAIRNYLRKEMDDGYEIMRSWPTGVEIIYKENSKGSGIGKLKNIAGVKTVITVGDYENDVSMLKEADISYAVENATKEATAAAKRSAPHVKDGAIAYIIEEIERNLP